MEELSRGVKIDIIEKYGTKSVSTRSCYNRNRCEGWEVFDYQAVAEQKKIPRNVDGAGGKDGNQRLSSVAEGHRALLV